MSLKYGITALFVLGLILTACTHITTPFETKDVNYQDTITIDQDLSLKFSNVTEDSRCPGGAQCIWEGKIEIVFDVIEQGEKTGELRMNPNDNSSVQGINEYSITLFEVKPYPEIDKPFNKTDYVATIKVSK